MTVTTYVDEARTRVRAEQEAVDAKIDAIKAFRDRVADVPTEPTLSAPVPNPPSSIGATTSAGTAVRAESSSEDRCRAVRRAFAETVYPHSDTNGDETESLLAAIREEFTDAIAVALAPTTETSFSPDLKRMLLSEANARQAETVVLRRTLSREQTQMAAVSEAVAAITDWIVETDQTPLLQLDFATLRQRHRTLATHRDQCETLLVQRQEFLQQTTNEGVDVGIRHRSLLPYLYEDFPVDHPVLSTLLRLEEACRECQRAVRDHLVRRV